MIRFVAVLALAGATGSALAEDLRWEFTPFGGYRFGGAFNVTGSDADYDVDDSSSAGFIVNLRDQQNTHWELIYAQQSSKATTDAATVNDPIVDIDTHTLQIGGSYQGSGEKVRPYVAATLGGTRIEASSRGSESDTFWSGSIGVGIQVLPSNRIGLRLEARAWGALVSSDTELLCRTGPDLNICAIRIEGDMLAQVETFAGVVVRF